MIFERIKSAGLAHNSYLVGSDGEAAVIDPQRGCDVYIGLAEREEQRIRYVFETHRNEDYVIGSGELSNLTGAEVFHGPGLNWGYGSTLHDGETFRIGSLEIMVVCNVGHRASLAASILLRAGYTNVCCDVLGSMKAWSASGFPIERK